MSKRQKLEEKPSGGRQLTLFAASERVKKAASTAKQQVSSLRRVFADAPAMAQWKWVAFNSGRLLPLLAKFTRSVSLLCFAVRRALRRFAHTKLGVRQELRWQGIVLNLVPKAMCAACAQRVGKRYVDLAAAMVETPAKVDLQQACRT
jgi:hypothetical protein